MHILLVSDAWKPQVNGVVRALDTTREILLKRGHTVSVLSPQSFPSAPIPWYNEIRISFILPGGIGRELRRISGKHGPIDAVHIATEGTIGWAMRNYCCMHNVPFTTSFHTKFAEYAEKMLFAKWALSGLYKIRRLIWYVTRRKISGKLFKPSEWGWNVLYSFHKASSKVLVTTPGLASELKEHHINHIHIWPRGVDLEWFHPSKGPCKDFEGLKRPIFSFVGRVSVEKNIEDFLQLNLPGTKVVIGDGPALQEMRAKYRDVVFTGYRLGEDLAAAYADSDVFVFPSRTDTFGLVLLEAMASGTPVSAYPVRGPIDVVKDPKAGSLDKDLAAASLRSLDLKPEDARSYAETFSWDHATDCYLNALEKTRVTGHSDQDQRLV